MSRVQLALNVDDVDAAVAFYARLFSAEPASAGGGGRRSSSSRNRPAGPRHGDPVRVRHNTPLITTR